MWQLLKMKRQLQRSRWMVKTGRGFWQVWEVYNNLFVGFLRDSQLYQNYLLAQRFQLYVIYVKYELPLPGIFVRIEFIFEKCYGQTSCLNMTLVSKYNYVFHWGSPPYPLISLYNNNTYIHICEVLKKKICEDFFCFMLL